MALGIIILIFGILLLLGLVRVAGVSGGLLGAVFCALGAGIVWGASGALLAGGLAWSFWITVVRTHPPTDLPGMAFMYPRLFSFLTNPFIPLALIIAGVSLLIF